MKIIVLNKCFRLLSMQHNFIKKINNLNSISRLVFLDLYHNRLDHISELDPLVNLRYKYCTVEPLSNFLLILAKAPLASKGF